MRDYKQTFKKSNLRLPAKSNKKVEIGLSKNKIKISRSISDGIMVSFSYNPSIVAKVKTIEGHKWHPEEKYWSFPDSDGILQKILRYLMRNKSV